MEPNVLWDGIRHAAVGTPIRREEVLRVKGGGVCGKHPYLPLSVSLFQFHCELKTSLKNKVLILEK